MTINQNERWERRAVNQNNLPVNFPANVSQSARMFFRRHGLAVGLFLLAVFKLWLVHTEDIYGSATEYDALWFVHAAKHWYWGSEYSWTAFVRPPAYPLFIAFVHLLDIPLRIGIELTQMLGYLALVAGLRKAGLFSLQYRKTTGHDDVILTESQRALYDEMTGRGGAYSSREGLSTAFENFIGSYHRFLVAGLSVAGLMAASLLAWRFRQLQISDSLNAVLILFGATVLLRETLFTFLDATWWIGGNERYFFPVMPMYSCFLILLIYQASATWRRRGEAR